MKNHLGRKKNKHPYIITVFVDWEEEDLKKKWNEWWTWQKRQEMFLKARRRKCFKKRVIM